MITNECTKNYCLLHLSASLKNIPGSYNIVSASYIAKKTDAGFHYILFIALYY